PGAVSQYKNLLHHYVHQTGRAEAGTFWAGCGAIRREVFLAAGGFAASAYPRPSIEDIELGVRLTRGGRRVVLRPEIQATHLKAWTLASVVRSDVLDRAIPWTRLVLDEGRLPDDPNLPPSHRLTGLLPCPAAAYDAVAPRYARLARRHGSALAGALVRFAELRPGACVLDVGTGTGLVALEAARAVGAAGRVIGVDVSAGMLAEARSAAAGLDHVRFQAMAAESLDLPTGSCHAVLSLFAIAH